MILEEDQFRIFKLPPYRLGELAKLVLAARTAGREIIDLSHFNPDLPPPSAGVDTLVQEVLRPENHRYSSSQGIGRLRNAAASFYTRYFGVEMNPETEVVATPGTKAGLAHLLLATASHGENILLPTPAYPIHTAAVFVANAVLQGVPLFTVEELSESSPDTLTEESSSFFSRLESRYKATWPRPKMMLLSFPHNPTTTVATQGFFERIVHFAKKHELFLIHDNPYGTLCFDEFRAPSILQVSGARELAVEFFSLSKSFHIPGWRMSFCVGNPGLISSLKKIKGYLDSGIFQPIQIAAAALLEDFEPVVEETREVYQSRRDVLVGGLRKIGWEVPMPKATVFLWAKLPRQFSSEGCEQFMQRALREAGIAICPGVGFDAQSEGFVRLALVEPETKLRRAVARFETVLNES